MTEGCVPVEGCIGRVGAAQNDAVPIWLVGRRVKVFRGRDHAPAHACFAYSGKGCPRVKVARARIQASRVYAAVIVDIRKGSMIGRRGISTTEKHGSAATIVEGSLEAESRVQRIITTAKDARFVDDGKRAIVQRP